MRELKKDLKESKELPGFFEIPRFSDSYINRYGVVINTRRGHLTRCMLAGYPSVNLPGSISVSVHRLMAMTFLECPGTFEDYVVNHLDGNKLNYSIDNLEWSTFALNNLHAYMTDLRSDNVKIKTLDITTNEVILHYSLSEAARFLKVNPNTVHRFTRKVKSKLIDGKYLVALDGMEFPDIFINYVRTNKPRPANWKRKPVPIKVTTPMGEIVNWPSVEAFSNSIGAKRASVTKAIWRDGRWKQYKIEYTTRDNGPSTE